MRQSQPSSFSEGRIVAFREKNPLGKENPWRFGRKNEVGPPEVGRVLAYSQ
jgi:hypothetical protein